MSVTLINDRSSPILEAERVKLKAENKRLRVAMDDAVEAFSFQCAIDILKKALNDNSTKDVVI